LKNLRYLAKATARSIRTEGLTSTIATSRNLVGSRLMKSAPDFTQQRFRLSERIADQLDYVVAYGPFEGQRLSRESWWSAADRGAMLLGIYEAEVLEALEKAPRTKDILVDVGAADGYYAIGCLLAGWVKHAYCFEASAEGREVIARNAQANGLADRVTILGIANQDFIVRLIEDFHVDPSKVLGIIDIEGGEFEILDAANLELLRDAHLVVELHEMVPGSQAGMKRLLDAIPEGISTRFISTGERNPGAFEILDGWPDDDRWMICSEGRAQRMRWLILGEANSAPA
jgi:hypothetical protein